MNLPKSGVGDVQDLVRMFFEDDESSRIMSGWTDYVSLTRNVDKQKQLRLCNLSGLLMVEKLCKSSPVTSFAFPSIELYHWC